MKNKIIFISLFTILLLGTISMAHVAQANDLCFEPSVTIPGMDTFFEACKNGPGYTISPSSIGSYIASLYSYAAGVAGFVAIFMIVFAAWQWIMASGNAGKIDNAKDTIRGALIGVALIFAGYLLMNSISSRLVEFKDLNLVGISSKLIGFQECDGLEEDNCNSQPFCAWLQGNDLIGTNAQCVDKASCGVSIETAYEYKDSSRLKCCDEQDINYQYALTGWAFADCQSICGDDFVNESSIGRFCGRRQCLQLNEANCKRFVGMCRWTEEGENVCLEEDGSTVEGMDCDENSDCDIYDPNYCCNSDDAGWDECRLKDEPGVVCY